MRTNNQYRFLRTLALIYLVIGLATRLLLMAVFPIKGLGWPLEALETLFLGLVNDLVCFSYVGFIPAAVILCPVWSGRNGPVRKTKAAAFLLLWGMMGIWLFGATAEFFFWEEFGSRFNFIAVDYLIYTKELIRNIIESYNLPLILSGIFLVALMASFLVGRLVLGPVKKIDQSYQGGSLARFSARAPKRAYALVLCLWLIVLAGLQLTYSPPRAFKNNLSNELSYNGLYQLFSAYWNNQLDYRQFYPVMPEAEALNILRNELNEPGLKWDERSGSLARLITTPAKERRLNVIQIVVESLGSDLLGEDTPNLNKLMENSLYFENLRATGTRTVRGIEALTLGVPPTPGSSIVRRPKNEDLFNIGSVFQSMGYDTTFIYGGFGYFDNMNAFFAGNGWEVLDRYAIPKSDISFANVWGVCDEDLYQTALKKAEASYQEGRNFYQFVLTTSNHRPFTYPEGKVAIPSGQGRRGAVQYTDYAIGRFLEEAQSKPWFKDTIFVIVADHSAGAAGKTVIPPQRYLIPALIYSPEHIRPDRVATLCSQIDLPPTILSLLGLDYEGTFFGRDILGMPEEGGRAYLGTYQLLGLMTNDSLAILAPNQSPVVESLEAGIQRLSSDSDLIRRAVAAYQTAQDFFVDGRMKKTYLAEMMPANTAIQDRLLLSAVESKGPITKSAL